jgi:hypothetical protein
MKSRKPRTLKLGTLVYLWRVHHRHRIDGTQSWAPASAERELVIENGYQLLREHHRELEAALAADRASPAERD